MLVAVIPVIGFIVMIAGRRLRKLAKKIQTAMGDVTHIASEAVDGNQEIKSFDAGDYESNSVLRGRTPQTNGYLTRGRKQRRPLARQRQKNYSDHGSTRTRRDSAGSHGPRMFRLARTRPAASFRTGSAWRH